MHCNIWHDKSLCGTNLCDWRLTCIICINKSHTEICHFMVYNLTAIATFYPYTLSNSFHAHITCSLELKELISQVETFVSAKSTTKMKKN